MDAGGPPEAKIINGEPARIEDNPWQVSLIPAKARVPKDGHFCGGSLKSTSFERARKVE